jgi:hypothetical protein
MLQLLNYIVNGGNHQAARYRGTSGRKYNVAVSLRNLSRGNLRGRKRENITRHNSLI